MNKAKNKKPVKTPEKTPEMPENLEQCFEVLNKILSASDVQTIKNGSEKDVCQYHFSLGMWIRNNWGLWKKDSKLYKYFEKTGLWHGDDMTLVVRKPRGFNPSG